MQIADFKIVVAYKTISEAYRPKNNFDEVGKTINLLLRSHGIICLGGNFF